MASSSGSAWRRSGIRDTVVTTAVLLGLLALTFVVPSRILQLPGYVLLTSFVPVGALVGGADSGVWSAALFALYVLVLGVAGSGIAAVIRERQQSTRMAGWRFGVAGGLAVTGGLALLFAARTLSAGTRLAPALTGLATGLGLLGLAAAAAGLLETPNAGE